MKKYLKVYTFLEFCRRQDTHPDDLDEEELREMKSKFHEYLTEVTVKDQELDKEEINIITCCGYLVSIPRDIYEESDQQDDYDVSN